MCLFKEGSRKKAQKQQAMHAKQMRGVGGQGNAEDYNGWACNTAITEYLVNTLLQCFQWYFPSVCVDVGLFI